MKKNITHGNFITGKMRIYVEPRVYFLNEMPSYIMLFIRIRVFYCLNLRKSSFYEEQKEIYSYKNRGLVNEQLNLKNKRRLQNCI